MDLPVHGGPGDAHAFGDLASRVLAGVDEAKQRLALVLRELRLLAAEPTFGFGDRHALAGSGANQVGIELGHDA